MFQSKKLLDSTDEEETSDIDYEISHYTIEELLNIFSLLDPSMEDIIDTIDAYIKEASSKNDDKMSIFYTKAKNTLITYLQSTGESAITNEVVSDDTVQDTNIGESYTSIYNQKPGPDATATKYTPNSVDYIKSDKNPIFRDTVHSLVNIDSFYRDTNVQNVLNTSLFTSTLTTELKNVIELKLHSVEIPQSWYVFSSSYGNTVFSATNNATGTTVTYTLPDGNYSAIDLIAELNTLTTDITFTYVTYTNKVIIKNISIDEYTIVFYETNNTDFAASLENANIGWNLGFRSSTYTISGLDSITGTAMLDIYGPKYLLLQIDDFVHNRPTGGLIGSMYLSTSCDYPSYLARDLTTTSTGNLANDFTIDNTDTPKRLTIAQQHTINSIVENRQSTVSKQTAPVITSDVLAKIPITNNEYTLTKPGLMFVDTGNYLSTNARKYFGQVNILKLRTHLLDDKGRTLSLNSLDWSYTLSVTSIYQT